MARRRWNNSLVQWIDDRFPIATMAHHQMYEYPMPRNLNYWWSFGSLAGVVLLILMLSGIFLSMQYQPSVERAQHPALVNLRF